MDGEQRKGGAPSADSLKPVPGPWEGWEGDATYVVQVTEIRGQREARELLVDLDELAREGAARMLTAALAAEVAEYIREALVPAD